MTASRVEIRVAEMRRFLIEAKKQTYAGEGLRRKRRFVKMYTYVRGKWRYEDRYVGGHTETGIEIVRYRGYPIWAMCYRGGMLRDTIRSSKETFTFLRSCLKKIPISFPVRGPKVRTSKGWRYSNKWSGSLRDFRGKESIEFAGEEIYGHEYFGGFIQTSAYEIHFL